MPAIVRELFEQEFCERFGVRNAIAVNSGTSALVAALMAVGLGEGDEVITTPFTFPSTVNAITLAGGTPVFCDVTEIGMINPALVQGLITKRTKAILPVHLFGRTCSMLRLMKIQKETGIPIIEDAAQAFGVKYNTTTMSDKYAGTAGKAGCFSFYKTKTFSTFEGGVVATDDDDFAVGVRCYSDPIENRAHGWPVAGHNFRMPEPCALIGYEQLKLHFDMHTSPHRKFKNEADGCYPYAVNRLPVFSILGAKCPVAEAIAERIRKRCS